MKIPLYSAVAIQPKQKVFKNRSDNGVILNRLSDLIGFAIRYWNMQIPCKLVAAPEFLFSGSGSAFGYTREDYLKLAITIPGEETEDLGKECKKYGIYFAAAAQEKDPEWPDRFFNTGFIISPEGKVILKYHKMNTMTNIVEYSMSPHDMMSRYKEKYGWDLRSLFPVVETEIGKLGVFTCYDRMFPEVTRALAVNGAELLIQPNAWIEPFASFPTDWWTIINRVRAIENIVYIVAPDRGAIDWPHLPEYFSPGLSQVVDYKGNLLSQCQYPGEGVCGATINIEELRHYRETTLLWNHIGQIRSEAYRQIYDEQFWPPNSFSEKPAESWNDIAPVQRKTIEKLMKRGIYRKENSEGSRKPLWRRNPSKKQRDGNGTNLTRS